MSVKAEFAQENGLHYRFWLEMTLENFPSRSPGKTACVVMQNPSYAGIDIADKSVQFMEKVVFLKGHREFAGVQRLIVVNQFARIQTNDFQGEPHEVGSKNNRAITKALRESEIIILAWGSSNPFEERKIFVCEQLKKLSGKQIFKTKMHPSRGRYEGFILPWTGV